MTVHERVVMVLVRVWLPHWHTALVFMFMMGIMNVPMLVHHDCVNMFVAVLLSQMQPKSEPHETARENQLDGYRIAQHYDRQNRTAEWSETKISAGSGCTEMAQRQHKQD